MFLTPSFRYCRSWWANLETAARRRGKEASTQRKKEREKGEYTDWSWIPSCLQIVYPGCSNNSHIVLLLRRRRLQRKNPKWMLMLLQWWGLEVLDLTKIKIGQHYLKFHHTDWPNAPIITDCNFCILDTPSIVKL